MDILMSDDHLVITVPKIAIQRVAVLGYEYGNIHSAVDVPDDQLDAFCIAVAQGLMFEDECGNTLLTTAFDRAIEHAVENGIGTILTGIEAKERAMEIMQEITEQAEAYVA